MLLCAPALIVTLLPLPVVRRYRREDIRGAGEDGMLSEALLALASAGGGAVVAAAGTDAWQGFRHAMARWLGRGDTPTEERELRRLDETAAALEAAGPEETERLRVRQEAAWQTRIELVLENLAEVERERAAQELRALLPTPAPPPGGMTVGRDAHFHAEGGSVAAGVVNGGVNMNPPSQPDPEQG